MKRGWLVLIAAAVACKEPAPVATTSTVSDSAGIRIVSSTAPAWGDRAAWKVAGSATLTLGGVAGDSALDFSGIVGAARLSDGSLVVANGGTREPALVLGAGQAPAHGGWTAQYDRKVRVSLSGFYAAGDSLVVWDGRARVLTHLTLAGEIMRQDTLRLGDSLRAFGIVGVFADGTVLAEAGVPLDLEDREPGFLRPGRSLFHFSGNRQADSIGVVPGEELYLGNTDGNAALSAVPFGLGSRLAVLPDGYVTSEGDRMQLEQRDMNGRLQGIVRWPGSRIPVSTDDIDRQGRALLGSAGTGLQRARLDSVWRQVPKPDSLPAVIGLIPDPRALAWVRRGGHVGDTDATWWVFSKEGAWLGSVTLPSVSSPLAITDEWIVLRTAGEDRIERVEMRRIRR